MALDLTRLHEVDARHRLDPLVLAYATLFACLILVGALLTFFGEPLDNMSAVHLDLTSRASLLADGQSKGG